MIIAILWWRYKTSKVVELVDNSKASCTDYAIMVRNLPVNTTKKDVIDFFSSKYSLDKVSFSSVKPVTRLFFAFSFEKVLIVELCKDYIY